MKKGTLTFTSGRFKGAKWVGQWKNGNQNGQGTLTFFDGEIIKGTWKDGEPVK